MKYTKEITDRLVADYKAGIDPNELAKNFGVPTRSVIAKLSSMGIYQRKPYTNKLGEPPEKKSEVILRLGALLDMPVELLESLEKVNKVVLKRIEQKLLQQ
jgi:hypothetical protein